MHQLPSHNIPDSAQTICRNWLLKIGAIRQLIPRSIIETTLLRLYFFIDNGKRVKHILYRLAKTNRCYGQYINSIFFSTFLIRIGIEVLPKEKEYILNILEDVFFYIKQGSNCLIKQKLSLFIQSQIKKNSTILLSLSLKQLSKDQDKIQINKISKD